MDTHIKNDLLGSIVNKLKTLHNPSDNLGGIIALAEALSLNGRDALLALIISYEIQCRFVDSVPFNENGWDQPVPGVIAMAMAAGRMLSLNVSSMRDALALAVTPNLCTYFENNYQNQYLTDFLQREYPYKILYEYFQDLFFLSILHSL